MAYHDTLTSLANRVYFEERLVKQIALSKEQDESFAVLFIDLNDFKLINDTHGHAAGDELLSKAGQRVTDELKANDIGARLGGDEFSLLVTGISSHKEISDRITSLRVKLSLPYHINGLELISHPSIGYALFPEDGTSVDSLLNRADEAMYKNKQTLKE